MKIKDIVLFVILFFVLASCTKISDYPSTNINRTPVVNAFLNNDNCIVTIFWNKLINDSEKHQFIENAEIQLLANQTQVGEVINLGNGKYKIFNFQAIPGSIYSLKINIPGYGFIYSQTIMPIYLTVEHTFVLNQEQEYIIKQTFLDANNSRNYYMCNISINKCNNGYLNTETYVDYNSSNNMYSVIEDLNLKIFDDKLFNGNKFVNSLILPSYIFETNLDSDKLDSIQIFSNLYVISSDLYKYYYDIAMQQYLIENAFAEPYPVYCNMSNAYGIFGAIILSSKKITTIKNE